MEDQTDVVQPVINHYKIKHDGNKDRRAMAVKARDKDSISIYEVPMPMEGDEFHIQGIVFKVTYQRDNPFRISCEPTGTAVLEIIQQILKAQDEAAKVVEDPEQPKTES